MLGISIHWKYAHIIFGALGQSCNKRLTFNLVTVSLKRIKNNKTKYHYRGLDN